MNKAGKKHLDFEKDGLPRANVMSRRRTRYGIPRNQVNRSAKLTHLLAGCSNEKRVHQHSQQEAFTSIGSCTHEFVAKLEDKRFKTPKERYRQARFYKSQLRNFSNRRSTTHSHTHSHTLGHNTRENSVANFFTVNLSKESRRTLRNAHLFFENTWRNGSCHTTVRQPVS